MTVKNPVNATRPLEYVAFSCIEIKTRNEGSGFIYLAVDAYLDYAFNLGVAADRNANTVLEKIYQLTELPEFVEHLPCNFTLVLEEFKDLSKRIDAVINPSGGKLLFNKAMNNVITNPVLLSLRENLQRQSDDE
jgi:hypothetical protein